MIRVFGTTDKTFTSNGGRAKDTRTGRKYRKVICKEHDIRYFEVA